MTKTKLTQRVEEFWRLSPPQSLVILGDDVIGLVFVDLSVEGHLVEEVVHLSRDNPTLECIWRSSVSMRERIYLFNGGLVRHESRQKLQQRPDLMREHPHGVVQDHSQPHVGLLDNKA